MRSGKEMGEETQELLKYMAGRGLEPIEACAIMGAALTIIIPKQDSKVINSFIELLRDTWRLQKEADDEVFGNRTEH